MLMQKKKIAVLGAGVMGTGIAQTFAAKGHEVMLIYVYDDKLRSKPLETMKGNLDILCQNDVMTEEEIYAYMMPRIKNIMEKSAQN